MAKEAFCEDLTLDLAAMKLWAEDDVKKFFDSGGDYKPSPPDVSDGAAPSAAATEAVSYTHLTLPTILLV